VSRVFKTVVCAVDDSDAGVVAAHLAAQLTAPDGVLNLISVDDTSVSKAGVFSVAAAAPEPTGRADRALRTGLAEAEPIHSAWSRRLSGDPAHTILNHVEERAATLLVIGTHGYRRATGIAFGLVGSRLLHDARCSVLVAHAERSMRRWPRSIVVGVDGSVESVVAVDTARELADRFSAGLRLVACAGGHADLDAARALGPEVEVLPARPVDALHVLSEASDLVVVGSRGLHGVRALGSVSERVAHRSACSVLVVRSSASVRG
jgi:nucleotide-binding universal stress UspA family protein